MRASLVARLDRLHSQFEPAELPTLFILIEDAGFPDPAQAEAQRPDYSVHNIIGVMVGHTHKVTRQAGESFEALKVRAEGLSPGTRVFWAVYGHDDARATVWEQAEEFRQ